MFRGCSRAGLGLYAYVCYFVNKKQAGPADQFSGMDMMNGVPIEDSPEAAAVAGHNGQ